MSKAQTANVIIHGDALIQGVVHRQCPHCKTLQPMDAFGLRTMRQADGTPLVREQSWCRSCRTRRPIQS
jgi:hypothetical protein